MNVAMRTIGPVEIGVWSEEQALNEILAAIAGSRRLTVTFCNAHTVNVGRRDPRLAAAMSGTMTLNDGIGVDIASKWLYGEMFPENLNGTDFTPRVLNALPVGTRVFLLGSSPGVAEKAAERISSDSPGVVIAGTRDGFFCEEDSKDVIEAICRSGAALTLVAMGQPQQEIWIARHRDEVPGVVMCVGALLDFLGSAIPRAPLWMRRSRLEWIWRLAIEPRRMYSRYIIGNVLFLAHTRNQRRNARRRHRRMN